MPLPAAVTAVSVHGQILQNDESGTPARGRLRFVSPYALRDPSGNVILGPGTYMATLDAAGEFTVSLPATDDPDITPSGWTYTVHVDTDAWTDRFEIEVPVATVGTLELADVAPVVTPPDVITYALASHTHEGGGASPSSTVVAETTYGQSSTAGAASAYSRGDHTHGTPAAATLASLGAATKPILREESITSGDVTLPNTAGAWAIVDQSGGADFDIDVTAVAGDYVEVSVHAMRAHNSTGFLDLAVVAAGAIVRYLSTGTSTPLSEGDPALYPAVSFHTLAGPIGFVVQSGDLSGGTVTVALVTKAAGTGVVYASTSYPWKWRLMNHGAVTVL
jgi:hypothetical protein